MIEFVIIKMESQKTFARRLSEHYAEGWELVEFRAPHGFVTLNYVALLRRGQPS